MMKQTLINLVPPTSPLPSPPPSLFLLPLSLSLRLMYLIVNPPRVSDNESEIKFLEEPFRIQVCLFAQTIKSREGKE